LQHEGLDCFYGLYTPNSTQAMMAEAAYGLAPGGHRYPMSPPSVS